MSELLVFSGGPIRTMDATGAQAVVVRDGVIEAVGALDLVAAHPSATHVDLAGRMLVPGFIDAHTHLSIAALNPVFGDASGIADRESLVEAIRAQIMAEPDAQWVRLQGWDDAGFSFMPTRVDLDAAGVDRPVVLVHSSLHQCVVSSAGLDCLGIGRVTSDPVGGQIGRDAGGEPNGLLVERAWSQAHAQSMDCYSDPDRWAEHIAARARLLLREGIVAVHDAGCSPGAEAVYRSMSEAGTLPVSVLAMPHSAALLVNELGARLDGPRTGDGDHQLRVGPVKLFADGGVAIALDVAIGGFPVRMGQLMEDLTECAVRAARSGYDIAVHAIGNAGVDHALAAFRACRRLGRSDVRLRLEHAGVTGRSQWRELAELGVVAVVQPGFVEHVGRQSGGVAFDDHEWLAFAGLAEAGVTLAGSSDDPCAPFPPLWCASKGVSRTTSTGVLLDAHQAVDLDQWLVAYTAGAALAGGQESERGRLAPGLRADLVVLEGSGQDPQVAQTWVAGRQVWPEPSDGSVAGPERRS